MTFHRLFQKMVNRFKQSFGIGVRAIKPDKSVNTNGVGDRYSGKYYVDEVSHSLHNTGYSQRFDLKRNSTGSSDENDAD